MVKRIVIVGCSGSGKTTLGRQLSKKLQLPFIDLDDLYWLPGWVARTHEEMGVDVESIVQQEKWIIVGNYSRYRHIIWPLAELIIWIDPPLHHCLWRGIKRSLRSIWNRTAMCNGNYDSIARLFSWGPSSIVWWIVTSFKEKRRRYESLLEEGKASQLPPHLRLKSKKELDDLSWLDFVRKRY